MLSNFIGNPNEVYSDDAFKADYQKNDNEKTIKKMSQKIN